MRDTITLLEAMTAIEVKAEAARLQGEIEAAIEAFHHERTRPNLEAVWAARQAAEAFTEHLEALRAKPAPAEGAGSASDDYRGEHQAPGLVGGSPLYDVCQNGIYPSDFYTGRSRDYAGGETGDLRALSLMLSYHRRPNAAVKIYRALPAGVPRRINPGDWVTIVRSYASEHGRSHLQGEFVIVSKTVAARDIYTDGNSVMEWGYDPQPFVRRVLKPGA